MLNNFEDKYISTIGTKITKKALRLRHPKENININMTLLIWDVMGDMNELPGIIHSYNKYSGNKADLHAISNVNTNELEEVSSKYKSKALFTSAKTGQNVEQAFAKLGKLMAYSYLKRET